MDPHHTDSDDSEDEDFVVGAEHDEESEGDAEEGTAGKRKLDDDDEPALKKRKKATVNSTTPANTTEKVNIDDIWAEMKKSQEPAKPASNTSISTDNNNNSSNTITNNTDTDKTSTDSKTPSGDKDKTQNKIPPNSLLKPPSKPPAAKPTTYTFAGEKVVIAKPSAKPLQKMGGALDNLVAGLGKKKNLSVLDKSKLDWDKFKTATGTSEELAHQKKNGYLEKVAFLQRADEKQFEIERLQRQNSRDKAKTKNNAQF